MCTFFTFVSVFLSAFPTRPLAASTTKEHLVQPKKVQRKKKRLTRRQGLLDLIGLVGVLEFEGVQETLSAELELDVLALCGFLQAGTYREEKQNPCQ
jgi:hypothetical protein